uniref:Uncharacterized protein n=1 Tax=Mycena chlorophos TaxID=658473 RepID=A0ABQ0M7D6_MYCCL|nr:predicted protein [Mycena chlorophos]
MREAASACMRSTRLTHRAKSTVCPKSRWSLAAIALAPPPLHNPAYIIVPSSTGRIHPPPCSPVINKAHTSTSRRIHPPPRSPVIDKAHTSTSIWCVRARSEPSMGRRNGPGRERAHEIRIVQEGERARKWPSARVAGSGGP